MAFAANRGSKGTYHWVVDYLPGLTWVLDEKAIVRPVPSIPINPGNGRFERDSLDLLGLTEHVVKVHPDGPGEVERLLMSRV